MENAPIVLGSLGSLGAGTLSTPLAIALFPIGCAIGHAANRAYLQDVTAINGVSSVKNRLRSCPFPRAKFAQSFATLTAGLRSWLGLSLWLVGLKKLTYCIGERV